MSLDLSQLGTLTQDYGFAPVPKKKGLGLDVIKPDLIDPDPNQPRKEFDLEELKELAESIKTYGLLQPIVLRKSADCPGRYVLVAGERRLRASQMAGLTEIKAVLLEKSDLNVIGYMQMAENLKRSNLLAHEIADFIVGRLVAGESQKEIAEKLGMSKSRVSEYSESRNFPEFLNEALRTQKINNISAAYALYCTFKNYPKETEEYVNNCETISRSQARAFNPKESKVTEAHELAENLSLAQEENFDVDGSSGEQEQSEKIEGEQIECSDMETVAEGSQAEADEFFPGAKIDESCYQPLEDQNEINNEQEENAEEAFKESPSEDSFDDIDASVASFPDEEEKEQLYKKPLIFCLVDGRECELLYKRKASDGIVCVKFEDGSEQEVIAEKVQLNRICEA